LVAEHGNATLDGVATRGTDDISDEENVERI